MLIFSVSFQFLRMTGCYPGSGLRLNRTIHIHTHSHAPSAQTPKALNISVLCSALLISLIHIYSTLQYSAVQHHVSRAARRTRPHFHQTKVTKVIAIRLYSRGETADMFQLNYKERTKIVPRMAVRKNIWLKNLFDCLCKGTRHNNNIVTIDRAQSRTM